MVHPSSCRISAADSAPTSPCRPGGAYPNPSGPLAYQISDADGVNQLINPIDGSPILLDVDGNPRTSNGLRSIGAV